MTGGGAVEVEADRAVKVGASAPVSARASARHESTRRALPERFRPRPLEIACGLALGTKAVGPKLPRPPLGGPRDAIEEPIRRALSRTPCLVSFSGGRDSAAVLAVACAVARRDGYDLPVPVTYRFPAAPGSHEAEWQEQVVRHLGLADWERMTLSDELDCVGPVAQAVLRRHGLLWPFNAHFQVPMLERAAGGSLLTGVGGDELFGPHRWSTAASVLAGRQRPRLGHLGAVGLALSPRPVREWILAGRHEIRWPWLHPEVAQDANRHRNGWHARTPRRWSGAIDWWWQSRSRVVLSASLALLAEDTGTQLVQPFFEPAAMAAVARHFGGCGPTDRSAAMQTLFGDVLPDAVLTRRSKAWFDQAFFSEPSRAFAAAWTGGGVDPALVDPERLAVVWAERPDPRSFLLLQAAWLSQQAETLSDYRRSNG